MHIRLACPLLAALTLSAMQSKNGSAKVTPAPLKKVRRFNWQDFFITMLLFGLKIFGVNNGMNQATELIIISDKLIGKLFHNLLIGKL